MEEEKVVIYDKPERKKSFPLLILLFAWNVLKFFVNDLKTDVQYIIYVIRQIKNKKPILTNAQREELFEKPWDWKEIGKELWFWAMLLFIAFILGHRFATAEHENSCNEFIMENYINPYRNCYEEENGDILKGLVSGKEVVLMNLNNVNETP